jgi:anti-anti-sigma factor
VVPYPLPRPVPTRTDHHSRDRLADFAARCPDATPPEYYADHGDKCRQQFRRTESHLAIRGQRWLRRSLVDLPEQLEHRRTDDPAGFVGLERDSDALGKVAVNGQPISVIVESGAQTHVVRIAGELDAACRQSVTQARTEGRAATVIVDFSALTFLDCGGYQAFVVARTTLEQHGRTLEFVGAVGEPRRLLDLIDQLDQTEPVRIVARRCTWLDVRWRPRRFHEIFGADGEQ